jgi:predicted HTH transcriptional regulator
VLLREILHNAVAHADYSRRGQHLNVSIYRDHLVVESPGKLPAGMNVKYLEAGVSVARNRALMNILHALGYVEKHGTVYAKALAASKEGYPIPEWSEPGPLLRVTLRPHPKALPDGSTDRSSTRQRWNREEEIFAHLQKHGKATTTGLAEVFQISERQIRKYLNRLEKAGRIKATAGSPNDPSRAYEAINEVGT